MRGLKKTAPDGAQPLTDGRIDGHGDSLTESAKWGQFSEKLIIKYKLEPMLTTTKILLHYSYLDLNLHYQNLCR